MRLMSEGFNVRGAPSGQAALDELEPYQPHLTLLDIKMPGMSGLDVLREIRGRDVDTPVVMMTAHGSESIAVEAFELGAQDYLIKPFDTAMAARRLRQVIDTYRIKKSREPASSLSPPAMPSISKIVFSPVMSYTFGFSTAPITEIR